VLRVTPALAEEPTARPSTLRETVPSRALRVAAGRSTLRATVRRSVPRLVYRRTS